MAQPKNMAVVAQQLADKKVTEETSEEASACSKDVPEGHSLVRLVRPRTDSNGYYYPAGLVTIPSNEVPKSAKVIKVG